MNTREKIDELKFIIGRFDHYYDSVNSKGSLYLAINTFILGSVITGYAALNSSHHFNKWILLLLITVLVCNLFSVAFTLFAIKPFLTKKNPARSMLYFGTVASQNRAVIDKFWNDLSDVKLKEELLSQYGLLAKGLNAKFCALQKATWFIAFQIAGVILFGIILLTYKNL